MKNVSKGLLATLIVLATMGAVLGAYFLSKSDDNAATEPQVITNFEECEAAGYPIGESFPRQCFVPDGDSFTEDIDEPVATSEFASEKGVEIKIDDFATGQTVESPLVLTGQVPGNWSFEASFGVRLETADGQVLAEVPAQIVGDWMTEELVPFEVTLTFQAPTQGSGGVLIIENSNPSGMDENADSLEIEVLF